MSKHTITLLNPGDMGASIGACAARSGHRVLWVNQGRSAQSAARAKDAGLQAVAQLQSALEDSDVVLSICPPHAALDTARAVMAHGFNGLYVDGNAIAPGTSDAVAALVNDGGARFCDGGIIGPPVAKAGTTRLFLSGPHAAAADALFSEPWLETIVLDGPHNAASSLKMCYAAWTKCTIALLADIRALATTLDVEDALLSEWDRSQAGLAQRSETSVRDNAFKAWRWIAEMNEIADTFHGAGLPDGFHRAAAEVYERLVPFKEDRDPPLAAVIEAMAKPAR